MTARFRGVLAGLLICACLGCEAPVPIARGLCAIRIDVQARPRKGYRPPVPGTPEWDAYQGLAATEDVPTSGAYERIDYRRLDDIVVWIEPLDAAGPGVIPPVVAIDVGVPPGAKGPAFLATGVGGRAIVANTGQEPQVVYSLSEHNEFDLGPIPPRGAMSHVIAAPGLIEVFTEAREDPVARIYAAPSGWVKLTRSGQKVAFTDLPPGRYRVACYHPRLPGSAVVVDLVADQLTRRSLTVSVNLLSAVP